MHLDKAAAPLIDDAFFPNTTNTTNTLTSPVWHRTPDSSADGFINKQAQNLWFIDFSSGNDNFLNKPEADSVRLVMAA